MYDQLVHRNWASIYQEHKYGCEKVCACMQQNFGRVINLYHYCTCFLGIAETHQVCILTVTSTQFGQIRLQFIIHKVINNLTTYYPRVTLRVYYKFAAQAILLLSNQLSFFGPANLYAVVGWSTLKLTQWQYYVVEARVTEVLIEILVQVKTTHWTTFIYFPLHGELIPRTNNNQYSFTTSYDVTCWCINTVFLLVHMPSKQL